MPNISSRSRNVGINTAAGFFAQILILLLSFTGRTIFLRYLSVDYLGINGLYSNVLSVLSLAELGIGNVMAFSLYKPVAAGEEDIIVALLRYFKKLYTYVALGVTVIGLLLIPFLQYVIQSELDQRDLVIYYLLFLLNSVASYFVAHKTACITAYQDLYVLKNINVISLIIAYVVQIIMLIIFHNYYIYVSVSVLSTLLNNYLISRAANKRYPYINRKDIVATIPQNFIWQNVKATFLYKIGTTIVNNTDNILISAMIGTAWVGYYSNYYMVVAAIQAYLGIVITSLLPSIGNLNAEADKGKSKDMFFVTLLFFHWCAAFGSISIFLLFGDLIPIWLGTKYVLKPLVVFAISLNFYITNCVNPIWMFRETMGLFTKVKYLMLATAILNLVLSVALGEVLGLAGILLATAIARILTHIWYEPKILFREKLGGGLRRYWETQFRYLLLTVISGTLCYWVSLLFTHTLLTMVVKGLMFFCIITIIFMIGSFHSQELLQFFGYIKRVTIRFNNT